MPGKPSNLTLISRVYSSTFQSFAKNPGIYAPFAIFALIEFTALILIFFGPQRAIKDFIRTSHCRHMGRDTCITQPISFYCLN